MRSLLALWNSPTFTTWMNLFVQAVNVLFIIPLIWKQWGALELGVYMIITSINRFSYLFADRLAITFSMLVSFVDAGSTDLRPKELLESRESTVDSDEKPVRDSTVFGRVYSTLGVLLLCISIVVGLVSSILGWFSIHRLGENYGTLPRECEIAFWLGIIAIVFRLNFFRYEILLTGLNKVALLARWNAIFNFVSASACVLAVIAGFNIVVWALIFNGMIIASCVRNLVLANTTTNGEILRFPQFQFHREVFDAVWSPFWRGLIGHVSFVGAEQLAVTVAPFYLSGLNAISFGVYIRFLSTMGPIAQVPFTSQIPRMARLIAQGSVDQLRALAIKRIAIAGFLVILGGWALGMMLPVLTTVLAKDFVMFSPLAWGFLVFVIFQDRFLILCTATMESGNKVVLYWSRFLCVLCSIAMFPFACAYFSVFGAILALYIPRVTVVAVRPVMYAAQYLQISWVDLMTRAWARPIILHFALWLLAVLFANPVASFVKERLSQFV
ncbi:hypothetical protein SH668x_000573 [Planctomicrobium sp. SH668]|uniref:hypothetical protein n=1 Tax=Planctomicrobium sp. SH668 TaxID=3448126 RepID=UPI003F5B91E1